MKERIRGTSESSHKSLSMRILSFIAGRPAIVIGDCEAARRSVPRRASLAVPPVHYRDQPVFPCRTMYQDWYWLQARSFDEQLLPMPPDVLGEERETLWMGNHFRLMRQGNSWQHEAVQHGARIYEFIGKVPKTNEAVFAVNEDGSRNFQLFCYSAPETLACYIENLERAWDRDGKGVFVGGIRRSSVTVWAPLDIGGSSVGSACHCPACRRAVAKGGEELLMGLFVKRLCERVKERWPDKTVIYIPWSIPKCPAEVAFPDNLVVSHLNLDVMGLAREPAVRKLEEDRLRAWSAKSGRPVNMWIDFASPGDWTYGPVQFPHLVQDFYSKNRDRLEGGMVLTYRRTTSGIACCGTPSWTWTRRSTRCAGGSSGRARTAPVNSCGFSASDGSARPCRVRCVSARTGSRPDCSGKSGHRRWWPG